MDRIIDRNNSKYKKTLVHGAEEGTRTPTPLRVHGPEPCASANSATSARETCLIGFARQAATLSLAKAAYRVKSRWLNWIGVNHLRLRASNSSRVRGQSE